MSEKEILKICSSLKSIALKPIIFNDIKIELLDVMRAKHSANTLFYKHHHPWFEFNYFSDGYFETQMCKNKFICKKGQSLLIPPGVAHSQKSGPDGDDGICIRWQISATKDKISEDTYHFLETINNPQTEGLNVNIKILEGLGENIQLNCSIFLFFVLSIYDKWQIKLEKHTPKQIISNQATIYMEEYLKNQITVTDVARALNMSYRNLARIFKKETGISVIEKLNELRINKAQKLLCETNLSISKIAEEVGFENVYYFSNTFKKYTRTSPKMFRENQK